MVLLGCRPPGRFTEQHDIFFGIGNSLKELVRLNSKAMNQITHWHSNGMMKIALNGTTGAAGVFGPTATRWGHLYGRYSICFKALAADGNGTAIMIWPSSDIWGDGEIDYPEGNFESTLQVFHHGVGCMECAAADGFNTGVSWREWHIATTEWHPLSVKYYPDEQLIKTVTHDIPKNNHRFIIQMAPNTNNSLPGYFYIDWVTIYHPVP